MGGNVYIYVYERKGRYPQGLALPNVKAYKKLQRVLCKVNTLKTVFFYTRVDTDTGEYALYEI